jgi:flagellar assembly factor FliW
MNAAAAMIEPESTDRVIDSALLGTLTVPETQVFNFERGLLGFPEAHDFALVPARAQGMFWLQSADFDALTFLLIDPFRFVDGYALDLSAQELGTMMPADAAEILVLAILTLPRTPEEAATANLQGPVAINVAKRKAMQVVLAESTFGIRHPVELKRS